MIIKKVFNVIVLMEDDMDDMAFDDLIEEGQNGETLYCAELVSTEHISIENANRLSIDMGSDGTFFTEA
jgi:hypothetical protein